jgi:hypothetical protein
VRDLVKIIHRAVERIDDPLMLACLIAHHAFFAVKRVLRKLLQQYLGDQFLGLNVDCEFDVMRGNGVDVLRAVKIFSKQLACLSGGVLGGIEIMLHGHGEWLSCFVALSSQLLNVSTTQRKKTGRKINSPPGLKFGVVTPKRFFRGRELSEDA